MRPNTHDLRLAHRGATSGDIRLLSIEVPEAELIKISPALDLR
jgi:hypothetical protein